MTTLTSTCQLVELYSLKTVEYSVHFDLSMPYAATFTFNVGPDQIKATFDCEDILLMQNSIEMIKFAAPEGEINLLYPGPDSGLGIGKRKNLFRISGADYSKIIGLCNWMIAHCDSHPLDLTPEKIIAGG